MNQKMEKLMNIIIAKIRKRISPLLLAWTSAYVAIPIWLNTITRNITIETNLLRSIFVILLEQNMEQTANLPFIPITKTGALPLMEVYFVVEL